MKVLLDIKDDKAAFVLELLENLKFVKTELLTPHKGEVLANLREAVDEVNQIQAGKMKTKALNEFLDDL